MGIFRDTLEGAGVFAAGTVKDTGKSGLKGLKRGAFAGGLLGAVVGGGVFALIGLAAGQLAPAIAVLAVACVTASAVVSNVLTGGRALTFGVGAGVLATGTIALAAFMSTLTPAIAVGLMAASGSLVGGAKAGWWAGKWGAIIGGAWGLLTGGTKALLGWQKTRGVEIQQAQESAKYENSLARRELAETLETLEQRRNQVMQPDITDQLSQHALPYETNQRQDGRPWVDEVGGPKERQALPEGQGKYNISKYANQDLVPELASGR